MGSGCPQLSVLLFRGGVYFQSSRIFEVPPGVSAWAGGGEGWGTGVGSGWPQLSVLLFRGGVYFRSSRIFEVPPGVGSGKWMATTLGSVVPAVTVLADCPPKAGFPAGNPAASQAKRGDMRNGREEEAGRGKGMWGEDGDNFPWSCSGSGSGGGGAGVGSGWPQLLILLLRR